MPSNGRRGPILPRVSLGAAILLRLSSALLGLLLLSEAPASVYRIRVAVNPTVGHSQRLVSERHDTQIITVRATNGSVMKTTARASTTYLDIVETTVRRAGSNATFRMDWRRDETEDAKGKQVDPMQGRTFTISVRGDDIGMMSSDGRPLPERRRESITRMMRALMRLESNNVCIPLEPLTVGATWKISAADAADCADAMGEGVGVSASTGTLTTVDGDTATVDYHFSYNIANLGPLKADKPEPVETTMRLRVSLTEPLRWTTTTKGHVAVTAHPGGPQAPSLFTDVRFSDVTQSTPPQ